MKVALVAFGLLACSGCVRASESMVREQAASAFACADYALHVVEVGPDVYRASGCGQELIYACKAAHPGGRPRAPSDVPPGERSEADVDDGGDEPVVVCARRPE